ncbi:HIT family protein [Janibacter sp. GXQ6167]|uniref:HIT family protein n=1 Tax=Janibacter sp. GXQ6167 TaxID=3240791 RepID=UPI0035235A5A
MSVLVETRADEVTTAPCLTCGFTLWSPIVSLGVSVVGLYDDGRFPGRAIVSLKEHRDHLEELTEGELSRFMRDIQVVSRALRSEEGVARVNVAILGNQEPHVHAHVIPRRPEIEPLPHNAPWQDTRPRHELSADARADIMKRLRIRLMSG